MRRPRRQGRRRGFTLVEMVVTVFLMALMATLLGNAWMAFGRPAIGTAARCRVAQEANLAAEAIAYDVGWLARNADPHLPDSRYQNAQAGGDVLDLWVDDGTTKVSYGLDPYDPTQLVRTQSGGTGASVRVVATLLGGFDAAHNPTPGFAVSRGTLTGAGPGGIDVHGVQIEMTFTHRTIDRDPVTASFRGDYTRCYTLFIPDPQATP